MQEGSFDGKLLEQHGFIRWRIAKQHRANNDDTRDVKNNYASTMQGGDVSDTSHLSDSASTTPFQVAFTIVE